MAKEPKNKAGPKSPSKWTESDWYDRDKLNAPAGKHAERDVFRTPAGHCIAAIDTKDGPCLSIRERGGAGILFGPTGDIKITAHNGAYNIIFGENRMEVTGTHDVTIRGGGTLKVDGDYDCTIGGNMNFTVDNDMNFKGKNFNMTATGNMDMVGKNMTVKTEGSGAFHSGGAMTITADGGVGLMSRGDSVAIAGATQVGIAAASGEVAIQSGGATHIQAGGDINADGSKIYLNSGTSQAASSVVKNSKPKVASRQKQLTPRSEV